MKAPLLYRLLLLLLPSRFRRDFGADLEAVLVERLRDAPGAAVRAWIWMIAVVDVFTSAPSEWAQALRHRRTGNAPGRNPMDHLKLDFRFALRSLGRRPGFTAVAVLTLALGIGANTALFSIVKTVLLDPLPYTDANNLVTIGGTPWTPAGIVVELQGSRGTFEEVAAYYPQSFAVTGGAQPYDVEGAYASPNLFRLLHARMALGRDFGPRDGRPGAPRTAIISHGTWERRYGGSPDVLGEFLRIDGEPHEIIGVLERGFRLFAPVADDPGVWVPSEIEPTNTQDLNEGLNYTIPLARLSTGVSLERPNPSWMRPSPGSRSKIRRSRMRTTGGGTASTGRRSSPS